MKIQIKSIVGSLLFEGDFSSLADAVKAAFQSGANLSGADLYGADLSGANLSRADLSGANLSRADLSRADLYGADLSRANLYGADLSRANLYGADLYGADLYGADLSRADLYGANLYGANLYGEKIAKCERPFISIGPIGSRCDNLLAFLTEKGVRIKAGCFFGTVKQFTDKLKETHNDNNHAKEYTAALAMITAHFELWKEVK